MAMLKVAVVDRLRTLFNGSATVVAIPSAGGDLGVLPGHQPLLVVLRPGTVRITDEHQKVLEISVSGGFASMDNDAVTVVVESPQD